MYGSYRPFNPVSKTIYRGGNSLNLALEQQIRGSSDPRWMTLKQSNSAGLRVANGAKAATVQYFNFEKVEIEPDPDKVAENEKNGIETEAVYEIRITSQYAYVFNGEDIEGLPAWDAKPPVMAGNNAALLFLEGHQQHLLSNEIIKSYYALCNIPEQDRSLDFSDCMDKIQVQLLDELIECKLNELFDEKLSGMTSAQKNLRLWLARDFLLTNLGMELKRANNDPLFETSESQLNDLHILLKENCHELFRAARDADQIASSVMDLDPYVKETFHQSYQPFLIKGNEKAQANERWASLKEQLKESVTDTYHGYLQKVESVLYPSFMAAYKEASESGKDIELFCDQVVSQVQLHFKDYKDSWKQVCDVFVDVMDILQKVNPPEKADELAILFVKSLRDKFEQQMLNFLQTHGTDKNGQLAQQTAKLLWRDTGLESVKTLDDVKALFKAHEMPGLDGVENVQGELIKLKRDLISRIDKIFRICNECLVHDAHLMPEVFLPDLNVARLNINSKLNLYIEHEGEKNLSDIHLNYQFLLKSFDSELFGDTGLRYEDEVTGVKLEDLIAPEKIVDFLAIHGVTASWLS